MAKNHPQRTGRAQRDDLCLTDILDVSEEAVFVVDHDFRFRFINKQAERILGRERQEMLDCDIATVFSEADNTALYYHLKSARDEKIVTLCDAFLPSGHAWIRARCVPAGQYLIVYFCGLDQSRQPEERLRLLESIIDHISDVVMVTEARPIDESGPRILYANAAFTRLTGYELHEVIGKTPRILQGRDTDRATLDLMRAKLEAWESFRVELLNYRKDGSEFWVELSVQPVTDDAGRYTHWIAVQRHITQRKQIEMEREQALQTVRESERHFRLLTDNLFDIVSVMNADLTLRYSNASLTRIIGWTLEELNDRDLFEFIHPLDRPMIEARIGDIFKAPGASAAATYRCLHKDGSWRWLESITINMLTTPGLSGILVTSRDVTERKALEAEREQTLGAQVARRQAEVARAQVEHILQSIRDGLITLDSNLCFTYVNRQAESLLQRSSAQLLGQRLQDKLPEMGGEIMPVRLYQVLANRQSMLMTISYPPGNAWIEFEAIPTEEGLAIYLRDVTRRRQAEEEVKHRNRQLQDLSRRLVEVQEQERGQIARELHDEIGQTLTGLKLTLGSARRQAPEGFTAYLDAAQTMIDALMEQVRTLSLDLRPAMLDDLGLLPTLLWHFKRYTLQTQIQVHFEHIDIQRRFDRAVETAAYRIIQEALTNVARHAQVAEVTVKLDVYRGVLRVQIEDQGLGCDANRALGSDYSNGLTGMRERARLLNGSLSFRSAPGAGAYLLAQFPLEPEEAAP